VTATPKAESLPGSWVRLVISALRNPRPHQARSGNQSCQIIGKYASGDAWDAGLVEVFWSDDDEGYIAVVPHLPGCSGFGKTPEAAVHELGDAIDAWIAACRASGDPVPEPRPRPAKRPEPDGGTETVADTSPTLARRRNLQYNSLAVLCVHE
jgi:antitoxin HicB